MCLNDREGRTFCVSSPGAQLLAKKRMTSRSTFVLPIKSVARILKDPEATDNDRYVARTLLKNSVIAANGASDLPRYTAIVVGKKGEQVLTGGDEAALTQGITNLRRAELRYSQVVPLSTMKRRTAVQTCRPRSIFTRPMVLNTPFCFSQKAEAPPTRPICFKKQKRC